MFSPSRAVADFSGQVVSVLDGDTIEVLHNNHAERIRLSGIKTALRHLTIGLSHFKQATHGKSIGYHGVGGLPTPYRSAEVLLSRANR
jgi:hypothetical protein